MWRIHFRESPASDPRIGTKLGDRIIFPREAPCERRREGLQRKVVQDKKLAVPVLRVLGIMPEYPVQLMHVVTPPVEWGYFRPDLTYSASVGYV